MGNGVRPGKYGTGLAVLAVAVAEEKRVSGRIAASKMAGLPHKTAKEIGPVIHCRTGGDYEVPAADAVADMNRSCLIADHGAVFKHIAALDPCGIPYPDIFDGIDIQHHDIRADASGGRGAAPLPVLCNGLHGGYELRPVAVQGHDVGLMG